jgi:hypothetical protein
MKYLQSMILVCALAATACGDDSGGRASGKDAAVDASDPCGKDGCMPHDDCFSPTKNTKDAYEAGAEGCACDAAKDQDVCVNLDGHDYALVCSEGHWAGAEDGPCEPMNACLPDDAGSDDHCGSDDAGANDAGH